MQPAQDIISLIVSDIPGFQPRLASHTGKWPQRLRVTPESFVLMIRFLINCHLAKMAAIRRKLDKQIMEDAAALCALVLSLAREVSEQYPIPEADLQTGFIDLFLANDFNLELQLHTAIAEKSANFGPADITHLQQLIAAHMASSSCRVASAAGATTVMAAQLEKQDMHK